MVIIKIINSGKIIDMPISKPTLFTKVLGDSNKCERITYIIYPDGKCIKYTYLNNDEYGLSVSKVTTIYNVDTYYVFSDLIDAPLLNSILHQIRGKVITFPLIHSMAPIIK